MIYRIRSYHGGLGDELQLTTLPERLVRAGHKVYLLRDSKEVLPFRNKAIKEFVWDTNPFLLKESGVEEGKGVWNCGDLPNLYANTQGDFIANWESAHGFNSPCNKVPKIYVKPRKRNDVKGVIELSSISLKYDEARVKIIVETIVREFPAFTFVQLRSPNQSNVINIKNVEILEVNTLFEMWDILCSAHLFVSLNSGSHSLAAAAREYNPNLLHYCLMPQKEYESMMGLKRFIYPSIIYLREEKNFA